MQRLNYFKIFRKLHTFKLASGFYAPACLELFYFYLRSPVTRIMTLHDELPPDLDMFDTRKLIFKKKTKIFGHDGTFHSEKFQKLKNVQCQRFKIFLLSSAILIFTADLKCFIIESSFEFGSIVIISTSLFRSHSNGNKRAYSCAWSL